MSLTSQSTQQKFPYPADKVFAKLLEAVPSAGMKIKNQDEILRRLTVSVGMSLFSWGENMTIVVTDVDDKSSIISIDSSLKFSPNIAGMHKHQKNFDKIIYSLSALLK
ncbi:hypothetical protein [Biostraticola tofi]|uniref:DUF1499 domain-containing protein n=1 Tax=Biostraticola tofi TaxID=466109 RepID=A0A4R3Z790_9GAMM|nr:hypothetical protein [Biostraticola tofi]TCW00385.1 hypothetical protein EDC52_101735 [Biostraticola tofi]